MKKTEIQALKTIPNPAHAIKHYKAHIINEENRDEYEMFIIASLEKHVKLIVEAIFDNLLYHTYLDELDSYSYTINEIEASVYQEKLSDGSDCYLGFFVKLIVDGEDLPRA